MSAYSEILIVRAGAGWATLPHLDAIAADPTHRAQALADGWLVVISARCGPEPDWPPALMQATGAPVMWCTITAMDSTFVRGWSQAGVWAGWLNTGGVAEELGAARLGELDLDELLDEGGQRAVDEALERLGRDAVDQIAAAAPALATSMARWARDAGLEVDEKALRALIETGDALGSRHLNNLLMLLHLAAEPVI